MSALVEQVIDEAVEHLRHPQRGTQARLAEFEEEIDRWDVRVENECVRVLAVHHPVASDLRRVAAVLKIAGELERVADFGVNLVERATDLNRGPTVEIPERLHYMARRAREMLHRAIDAFVELDPTLARRVCLADDEIDQLNVELIEQLIAQMERFPHLVRPNMHLFSTTRYLERVADHATNIAEDVVFLVEGEIIRHQPRPE